jgi:zinc transport system ATP-binding protein
MSPEPLVAFEGVASRYDGDVALEGIDLVVEPGERLAVLGPNGGGKTTLIALLLGLRRPSAGRIRWGRPPRELRRAHVPQFPTFDRHFPVRVREMVAQGRLRPASAGRADAATDRAKVAELIERLELAPLAEAHLSELSGGELKRALIARALAAEPELLALDEPTASLDEPSRRRLWELVAELPASTAIVLATHDLAPETFAATRAFVVDRRLEPLALDRLHAHELVCGHSHG